MKQLLRALALSVALLAVISSSQAQSRVFEWPTARGEAKAQDRGPRDAAKARTRRAAPKSPKASIKAKKTKARERANKAKGRGREQARSDKPRNTRAKAAAPSRGKARRQARSGASAKARSRRGAPAAPKVTTAPTPPAGTHVVGKSTLRELVSGIRSRLGDVRRRLARWQASRTTSRTPNAKTPKRPATQAAPKRKVPAKRKATAKTPRSKGVPGAKQPVRQAPRSRARNTPRQVPKRGKSGATTRKKKR